MSSNNTILIVDDEPNLRLTLGQILRDSGYTTSAAADGREALTCLQAGPYDLVFLDLNMPEMNGLTLLREIRRLYPEMPVLILTGYATLESATEAVRLGARDYLDKPVDPAQILARVREIMTEQKQPRRRREIVEQIQALLSELQEIDGVPLSPPALLRALPTANSARFLQRGRFTLDLLARNVLLGSKLIPLTDSAFDYLVTLVRHSPETVSYPTLVFESQGPEMSRIEAQETARWWVHQLRKAIEPNPTHPQFILTVRGKGYRLLT